MFLTIFPTSLYTIKLPCSPLAFSSLPSTISTIASHETLPAEFQQLDKDVLFALLEKAKEVYQSLSITKDEAVLVERETRMQRQYEEWYHQRKGRLTVSSFHDILVRRCLANPDSLVRRLLTKYGHRTRLARESLGTRLLRPDIHPILQTLDYQQMMSPL